MNKITDEMRRETARKIKEREKKEREELAAKIKKDTDNYTLRKAKEASQEAKRQNDWNKYKNKILKEMVFNNPFDE